MISQNYSTLNQQPLESNTDLSTKQAYALLMVNSSSGSRMGNELLGLNIKQMVTKTKLRNTNFSIHNLYEQKDRDQAFGLIKTLSSSGSNIYVIICGGDGTVEWVISESLKYQIDFEVVIFSILPIGTGNDFAKSTGWGNYQFQVSNNIQEKLYSLAKEIEKCTAGYFDIWQSSIDCFQSGSIVQIKNGEEVARSEAFLVKNFTNYFGIGTDAQIAFIAQKLRAKTAALKRVAYGFAGFLSFWMFCGSLTRKISNILQIKSKIPQSQICEQTQDQIEVQKQEIENQKAETVKISRFDCCMTFINSTSSMDLQGIWQTPYKISSKSAGSTTEFKEQSVDDGIIEIVSYRNQLSLWFERFLHMAKKVGQGNGPFIINFKEPKQNSAFITYIQINGQPYKIANLKSITVRQSQEFLNGKIRVLYGKNMKPAKK